jgi:DNA-binding winged helix-turn-helix (wHTH) protein
LIYNFDDCSLDVDRQELRRGGVLVEIEPQVLDLLQYLIRNRDRIVSKDDLIANVWKRARRFGFNADQQNYQRASGDWSAQRMP